MELVTFKMVWLLICFIWCLGCCVGFETASFYGASYVSVPLQEAKSTTEITLRFRTKQTDALLFLAAGRTDYCLIRLQSGKLKVHINLGAGESEISSPKGLRFDDLIWHHVTLSRKDGEVNLTIDRIHNAREKLPGRFFELNIYDGLFLGGIGDTLDLFLGHVDWLRGCLSAVMYNGIDVLKRARYRNYQSDAHGVSWSCAAEFDASYTNEIGFMEEGAYITLPNPISRTGVRWQFDLKTMSENAMLLYNSKLVVGGRTDYVGLEIVNYKLRLVVDTGSGSTDVVNEAVIADGEWHTIVVQFNPNTIEVIVDGKHASRSHPSVHIGNKYLDLSDVVYIGGLELNKRANALALGMKSADTSLKGCIRNIDADGKLFGIPNARVTQGILPACVWHYPCAKSPCSNGTTCIQKGVSSYQCSCKKPCVEQKGVPAKETDNKSLPIILEILSLNAVNVMEGDKTVITADNIDVILDYAKYDLRSSNILFYVLSRPHFGHLSINSVDAEVRTSFSLSDLSTEKVHYIHDGSENFNDSIAFEFELSANLGYKLPLYLQGRYSFVLEVNIAPLNDAPVLSIPEDKEFAVAQGTARVIISEYLNATDVDNSNAELMYTVFGTAEGSNSGHVELLSHPGQAITSFSQSDIDEGQIIYRDAGSGVGSAKLGMQVSDGMLTSPVSYLRIAVFPLQLYEVNNTGLVLVHKSVSLITPYNLTFKTNAEDPTLSIVYKVTEAPKYGFVQCFVEKLDEWKVTDVFSSSDLKEERIRYLHTKDNPSDDIFKFVVAAKNVHLPTEYEFKIRFVQLQLLVAVTGLKSVGDREILIDESHLRASTEPLYLNRSAFRYTLLNTPRFSDLLLNDVVLKRNDTWTQEDIYGGSLQHKLHFKTYSYMEDSIQFLVTAPYCEPKGPMRLTLFYTPTKEMNDSVQIVIHPVQVTEGGQQPILLENLSIVKGNMGVVVYNILEGPNHGWIDMYNVDHIAIEKHNITQFTSADLIKQKVTYFHDDAEHHADNIKFVVYSAVKEDFQSVVNLPIEISLKNDNPPYCVVNTGLRVITDGDKLLTNKNLLYEDSDVDTKPENITYTRQAVSNGAFILSSPPYTPLFEFTQDDINNERILFRHSGPPNSTISIWVSDGEHYLEVSFQIYASAPYIKIENNSRLSVKENASSVITTTNLYSDTNYNVRSKNIRYEMLSLPKYGHLQSKVTTSWLHQNSAVFTQEDVEKGFVSYQHDGGKAQSFTDKFEFRVSVGDVFQRGIFEMRIYPEEYFTPLIVVNNGTIYVEESTSITITRNDLLIQQPKVPASDILYLISEPPLYGYLEIDGVSSPEENKDSVVTSFDQSMIDSGKVHYVHLVSNETYDRLILDVTNGIISMEKLMVTFVIIPENLYISGGELRVKEGSAVTLSSELFTPYSSYYVGKITEYKLKKSPRHGWFQHLGYYGKMVSNITRWTVAQLQNSQIQYVHDGAESLDDTFTVVAHTSDKESVPAVVRVSVTPVNDEPPIIVNNTGLVTWRGDYVLILPVNLAADDKDTEHENLTFAVINAVSGHLAFASKPSSSVDKFTQRQVDDGHVIFLHSGENSNGEFDVVVSDGEHTTEPITIIVKTVMPSIYLSKIGKLQVFPLMKKPITSALLLSWCTNTKKDIWYVVKQLPSQGMLVKENSGSTVYVTNFTQSDANATRIWYQHTSRILNPVSADRFVFDILADYAYPITNQIFDIEIGVSFGGLDSLMDTHEYEVLEGGRVPLIIDTSKIVRFLSDDTIGLTDPTIVATTSVPPTRGTLCVHDHCYLTQFTNEQLISGSLMYVHDHSDSLLDSIVLTVYLDGRNVSLCNITIHIKVKPVNDQPFRLLQDSPNLTVVQGGKVVISSQYLLTEDADTGPHDIVYDVINRPNYGSLLINGSNAKDNFTQADINSGRVVYQHSGPVQSSSFYFRVSDGQFKPEYKIFAIRVEPAMLSIGVTKEVNLKQGSNSTVVSDSIFEIQSNLEIDEVVFNLTTLPKYGFLLVSNSFSTSFSQSDLKYRKVSYFQSNMNSAQDDFELEAGFTFSGSPVVTNLWVNVTVEPLLKIGKFTPSVGTKNKISTEIISANTLAKLTNSNPMFTILKKPKFGKIKKIVRNSGTNKTTIREREIDKFTQEELKSGVIYYIAKKAVSAEDSFTFMLSAPSVQPAMGEMKFSVTDSVRMSTVSTKGSKKPEPKFSHDGVKVTSQLVIPNITDDSHAAAIIAVSIVIAMSLVFVCILRYQSLKREKEEKLNAPLPPLPLPRPPDDLMQSSPSPLRTSVPTLRRKVASVGVDTLTRNNGYSLGYPYGTVDEDWSSCDTANDGTPTNNNPLLRRNQYWV